jgi:hypothetical protein
VTTVATRGNGVDKPDFFRVVATHPNLNGRTFFRSVSEKRARAWLEVHYPRGSEAHLVTPDGDTHHFEAERAGERGADIEQWQPFDPSEWVPTEQAPPPGQDAWSDAEG